MDKPELAQIVRECELEEIQKKYFKRKNNWHNGEVIGCCAIGALVINFQGSGKNRRPISDYLKEKFNIDIERQVVIDTLPRDVFAVVKNHAGNVSTTSVFTIITVTNDNISRDRAADMIELLVDNYEGGE